MEDAKKWSVGAIARDMNISVEELANRAGIKPTHLRSVSLNRATITGDDLIKIALLTGISPFEIKTTKD